ncbi:hypothetical protein ACFWMG_04820 [Streptomyces sp. NPDC127074]|uniref:hypothetical protein n=1 Tax=Streptomyces sp. NPDC127074 TaxID=3347130 RepID=UPI003655E4AC
MTQLASTTWHAHIRIDTRNHYAEYNDTVDVIGLDDGSTKQGVIDHVTDLIISAQPSMKSGKVTICRVEPKR